MSRFRRKLLHYGCAIPFIAAASLSQAIHGLDGGLAPPSRGEQTGQSQEKGKPKSKQKKPSNTIEVSAAQNVETIPLKTSNSYEDGMVKKEVKSSERRTSSEIVDFGAEKDGKPLEKTGLM